MLRIVSIIMIIACHSIYHNTTLSFDENISANKLLYDIFHYGGELGVNCFILISGYFLPTTTFKLKKLVLMILQVYLYFYGCRTTTILFTKAPIDAYDFSSWFFPILQCQWWFVTAYLLVYTISPFLQKLILAMNKKEFEILICSQLFIWCVFPTVFLSFVGKPTASMEFYSRYIFMILFIFIGAYIRIYGFSVFSTVLKSLSVFAGTAVLLFSYILLTEIFFHDTDSAVRFFDNNSLFQVILSLSLFCFFKDLHIGYHPRINRIARCVFGIYLLHEGPFKWNIWHKVFVFTGLENNNLLFPRIICAVVVLMFAGIIIEFCRQPFEKYISNTLDKIFLKTKSKT